MAKASTTTKVTKTTTAKPAHPPYSDMIKEGIISLKDRNGSSRQALKKYIQNNFKISAPNFDSLFNSALRRGVDKEIFIQPKGTSGPVKLNKKTAPVEKKTTPTKKTSTEKKTTTPSKKTTTTTTKPKKATAKKVTKKAAPAKKPTPTKKTGVTKKATPAKKAAPKKKAATSATTKATKSKAKK